MKNDGNFNFLRCLYRRPEEILHIIHVTSISVYFNDQQIIKMQVKRLHISAKFTFRWIRICNSRREQTKPRIIRGENE